MLQGQGGALQCPAVSSSLWRLLPRLFWHFLWHKPGIEGCSCSLGQKAWQAQHLYPFWYQSPPAPLAPFILWRQFPWDPWGFRRPHMLLRSLDARANLTAPPLPRSYLAPIVHDLAAQQPPLSRSRGTLAVVICPTRELCLQVADVLTMLVRRFVWLVRLFRALGHARLVTLAPAPPGCCRTCSPLQRSALLAATFACMAGCPRQAGVCVLKPRPTCGPVSRVPRAICSPVPSHPAPPRRRWAAPSTAARIGARRRRGCARG